MSSQVSSSVRKRLQKSRNRPIRAEKIHGIGQAEQHQPKKSYDLPSFCTIIDHDERMELCAAATEFTGAHPAGPQGEGVQCNVPRHSHIHIGCLPFRRRRMVPDVSDGARGRGRTICLSECHPPMCRRIGIDSLVIIDTTLNPRWQTNCTTPTCCFLVCKHSVDVPSLCVTFLVCVEVGAALAPQIPLKSTNIRRKL